VHRRKFRDRFRTVPFVYTTCTYLYLIWIYDTWKQRTNHSTLWGQVYELISLSCIPWWSIYNIIKLIFSWDEFIHKCIQYNNSYLPHLCVIKHDNGRNICSNLTNKGGREPVKVFLTTNVWIYPTFTNCFITRTPQVLLARTTMFEFRWECGLFTVHLWHYFSWISVRHL